MEQEQNISKKGINDTLEMQSKEIISAIEVEHHEKYLDLPLFVGKVFNLYRHKGSILEEASRVEGKITLNEGKGSAS